MESAAKPADVVTRWRPFEDEEAAVAAARLKDIHRIIRKRFRDLEEPRDLDLELEEAKVATTGSVERDWWEDVVQVEAEAVIRSLIPGPDRWRVESIDDFSGTRTPGLDGTLALTPDEWVQIGVLPPTDDNAGKAFTIDQTPTYEAACDVPYGYRRRLV